ncbi:hypothetical protein M1843_19680 [Isoptericola sp. 4D.3]|uniref:Integral membrane protein n=1 Tax=Isoptericola peretonis TaxID=2918523 RepID=A0ABT0J8Z5_9MICO|nr:hypothetical protein [Isoptericola sp. 4D.3]
MWGGGIVVVGIVAVAGVAALAWVMARFASQLPADDGGGSARAARRHETIMSAVALAAAAGCASLLLAQPVMWPGWAPAPGVLQALTPFAVALAFCAVRAVGERTWPRPAGEVRTAPLTRRTVRSLGGVRLTLVLVTAGVLAIALVAFGVTADPTGRAFATAPVTLPDGGTVSGSAGPYPGWAYGAPMLAALAVTLAATLATLTAIVRRPPLHGVPAPHDDAVRATGAARLLGGVQVCLGVALGGTVALGGSAIRSTGHALLLNGAAPLGLGALGVAVGLTGVAIALASVVAGLLAASARPARQTPRTPPARRTAAA